QPVESTIPGFSSVQYLTTQPSIATSSSSPKEAYASRISLNPSINIVNLTQLPTSSPPKSQSNSIISNNQKPFLAPRETNLVIELSDESDNERSITGLIKQVKKDIYPDSKLETEDEKKAQSDAKKKLEEKEREIKRMNELIASKMESLKKNKVGPSSNITTLQDKVSSNSNVTNAKAQAGPSRGNSPPPDIATIRAELEIFETAKANLNEIRSKIEAEERELSDIRSRIKDQERLENDYEKMNSNFNTQRDELVNSRNALEVRKALIESQLDDINRQIEDSNSSILSKETEIKDALSEKAKFMTRKTELVSNEKTVSENVIQLKKQLSSVHKTIVAKKELLLKLVKPKNEAGSSTTNHSESNSTGKRTVSPEDATPRAVTKKAKLTSSVSGDEVAQLSKRMEKVSKEHQELLQSLTLLNKRKGKKVVTSTSNANASEADAEILYSNNGSPSDSAKSNVKEHESLNTELMDVSDSYTKSADTQPQVQDDSSFIPYES
ncbi:9628_t:CDS:2, partial [Dentiscutata heterogama]